MNTSLQTFDGLDNRKEVIILLQRLGCDKARARVIESLIPSSLKGFKDAPMKVNGDCDPVTAYFMMVGVCNELGVDINVAAQLLEKRVNKS